MWLPPPGIAACERFSSVPEEALEAVQIELVALDVEYVAGWASRQSCVSERFPEPRDVVVEGMARRRRRPLSPEAIDEAVAGDDLVGVQEEDREQRTLLRAPERKLTAVVPCRDGTENRELHRD